jgi:drug/metabolite transporter (DMT)-like permease
MERAAVSLPAAGVMLVVGVVATALPLALLLYGSQRIGAPRAGILGTLEPLCGVGLACAVNGEHLAPAQIAGAAALLVTSLLQARP